MNASGSNHRLENLVYSALREELGPGIPPLAKLRGLQLWQKACKSFDHVLGVHFEVRSQAEKLKAIQLLIGSMIKWLKSREIPVGIKSIIVTGLPHLYEALDEDYPGYRDSGLLSAILGHLNAINDRRPRIAGEPAGV